MFCTIVLLLKVNTYIYWIIANQILTEKIFFFKTKSWADIKNGPNTWREQKKFYLCLCLFRNVLRCIWLLIKHPWLDRWKNRGIKSLLLENINFSRVVSQKHSLSLYEIFCTRTAYNLRDFRQFCWVTNKEIIPLWSCIVFVSILIS